MEAATRRAAQEDIAAVGAQVGFTQRRKGITVVQLISTLFELIANI
jgi:hypothetical protein